MDKIGFLLWILVGLIIICPAPSHSTINFNADYCFSLYTLDDFQKAINDHYFLDYHSNDTGIYMYNEYGIQYDFDDEVSDEVYDRAKQLKNRLNWHCVENLPMILEAETCVDCRTKSLTT